MNFSRAKCHWHDQRSPPCATEAEGYTRGVLPFRHRQSRRPRRATDLSDTGTVTYSLTQITHIPLAGVLVASDAAPPFHLSSQNWLGAGIGDVSLRRGPPRIDPGSWIAV
jgi:hypothetical protein